MMLHVRSFVRVFFLVITFCVGQSLFAQPVLSFTPFVTGLNGAVDLVNASDGTNRLFIVQKNGTIRIHNGTSLLPVSFINLADTVLDSGEQGLLSLAFHPDYETNRYFFVWYTDKEGDLTLARYQSSIADPNVANGSSEVVLLEIPKPGTPYFTNHNGGKIGFGPDGYLYVSIGDGGSGGDPFNLSQNGNSLLGKMLRLDVNNFSSPPYYSIPPGNPYISDPTVRDEIWSLGLRNPWRWSFDRQTGDLWIADVGQSLREEVNFRAAGNTGGTNYGWRCYEGTLAFNTSGCGPAAAYVSPIFEYPHNNTTGGFSITGGYVYRGTDFPFLNGYYIVADYVSGNLWKIRPNGSGGWQSFIQSGLPGNISGFGESENGRLYAVSLNGNIYVVEANSFLPVKLSSFSAVVKQEAVQLRWKTEYEEQLERFEVERSSDGTKFETIASVKAHDNLNGSVYQFDDIEKIYASRSYRLRMVNSNQTSEYSKIIRVGTTSASSTIIQPTILNNGTISIQTDMALQAIQVRAMDGRVVYREPMNEKSGFFTVRLPNLATGVYSLQLIGTKGKKHIQKIVIQ